MRSNTATTSFGVFGLVVAKTGGCAVRCAARGAAGENVEVGLGVFTSRADDRGAVHVGGHFQVIRDN